MATDKLFTIFLQIWFDTNDIIVPRIHQYYINTLSVETVNSLTPRLKLHRNGQLHSNMVIGTLAVDVWAVAFGAARKGLGPTQSPPRCTKCNSPSINGPCTNFILFDVALELPLDSQGLTYILPALVRTLTAFINLIVVIHVYPKLLEHLPQLLLCQNIDIQTWDMNQLWLVL